MEGKPAKFGQIFQETAFKQKKKLGRERARVPAAAKSATETKHLLTDAKGLKTKNLLEKGLKPKDLIGR